MNLGVDVARAMTPPRCQPGVGLRPGEAQSAAPFVLVVYAALFVGVRRPIEVVMARRDASPAGSYATSSSDGSIPAPVLRWQREVHVPGIYDLEVDTSVLGPEECAEAIRLRLEDGGEPTAFRRLAEGVH